MVGDGRGRRFGRDDVNRPFAIPDALQSRQARASDPSVSAWVSANAGSGKTHVLTQRVLRLLLAGAPPARILGLTFTKAAAANMAGRVFGELAKWTSLDDDKLAEAIIASGAREPEAYELKFARQLFARAIETPGGLKIQTLHAFSERLLRLFPFEANVAAHFRVADERAAKRLLEQARDEALADLKASAKTVGALELVAREVNARDFDPLLREALGQAETFEAFADARAYATALRAWLGIAPGATAASIEAEMIGGDIGRKRREGWVKALGTGSTNDKKMAAKLCKVDSDCAMRLCIEAQLAAFFTEDGEGPPCGGDGGRIATKGLAERMPELERDLHREQDRLGALRELRRGAQALERSEALFTVAKSIRTAFARLKAERGELDFDDQISRALALVTRSSAAWVLHKLDYGLDHLLLDEAQDTSAAQWGILAALSAEFFAGAGARKANRTVFAVGDEKQSIFSFQGAAPEKFAEMKRAFERRHRDAERPFAEVPLNFSFRSSPTILEAVDMTFKSEGASRGVSAAGEPALSHEAIRRGLKGVVELWPPVKPSAEAKPEDWRMPLDEPSRDHPAVVLARRIADVIKGWVSPESRERIIDAKTGEMRRIRESDVMILVRTRNVFFEAMIRALKTANVKAAGADRLMLRDHIAVTDLIAVARTALLQHDDLALACALKSPLIGLDEDALFRLAARRSGSLASALAASRENPAVEAANRIASWRARARKLSPFEFYARLLGEDGGRKALIARLGPDAADPIDEILALALAHEQREAPSLHRFLAEVEADDAEIKRDMEAEAEGVRVLTVHASKGLEAPIVLLPDTCGAPDGRRDPKLLRLAPVGLVDAPLFAWGKKASEDAEKIADARRAARAVEAGEHRRLLYVAMTRTAQRLIVAGFDTSTKRPADCWYGLIESGISASAVEAPAPFDPRETILRFGEGLRAEEAAEARQASARVALPAWISVRPSLESSVRPLSPSRVVAPREAVRERVELGRLAHELLQSLPGVATERRAAAARAYLDAHGSGIAEASRAMLAAQIVAAIEAPELAPFFGPNSRGEVSLAGRLQRFGREDLPYSGRLDRLIVTGAGVSIVDFKLGAAPVTPPNAFVAQIALYRAALQPLYPGLSVRAALVYLDGPTLAPIHESALDAALEAVLAAP
jgi:ATP-dependent helicase/nuclease subunit A